MVDIQSATAETGEERKKKIEEETTGQCPHLLRRAAIKTVTRFACLVCV